MTRLCNETRDGKTDAFQERTDDGGRAATAASQKTGPGEAEIKTAYRKKFRDKAALKYCPMPPGITYYEQIAVRLADGATRPVMGPKTKPLAACCDDDDVLALIRQLGAMATQRGLKST